MSHLTADDPVPGDARSCDAVETVIVPRARDLGGFEVRRALPSAQRQMVGPFIFFDQMGPALMQAGQGIDVRPHPHIGLSTVTWLFDGEIFHRDSLGSATAITPGALNWMTAGRGIVHSERTPAPERSRPHQVWGIQSWVALPKASEEQAPAFDHYAADALPSVEDRGIRTRIIAGSLWGRTSPVRTAGDLFYAEAQLAAGARLPVDAKHEERAVYVVDGSIEIGGISFEAGRLLVLRPGDPVVVEAKTPARVMVLGGATIDGPRYIWWNFVSSSKERIEAAKEDWKQRRFDIVPGDEAEFIPLPG
ncbi:MAG: pirin family protein [Hyphomicrobiales bacterium]